VQQQSALPRAFEKAACSCTVWRFVDAKHPVEMSVSPPTEVAAPRTFGHAWVAVGLALAVHVADEAAHDFLALYNPSALAIQQRLGGFPFPPTFSFTTWLAGLLLAVVAWLALAPLAYRGRRWLLPLATIATVVHVANGLGHILTSFWLGRAAPGVWSAPLLLASAVWMLTVLRRLRRAPRSSSPEIAVRAT
jgi:hypothetical protein